MLLFKQFFFQISLKNSYRDDTGKTSKLYTGPEVACPPLDYKRTHRLYLQPHWHTYFTFCKQACHLKRENEMLHTSVERKTPPSVFTIHVHLRVHSSWAPLVWRFWDILIFDAAWMLRRIDVRSCIGSWVSMLQISVSPTWCSLLALWASCVVLVIHLVF